MKSQKLLPHEHMITEHLVIILFMITEHLFICRKFLRTCTYVYRTFLSNCTYDYRTFLYTCIYDWVSKHLFTNRTFLYTFIYDYRTFHYRLWTLLYTCTYDYEIRKTQTRRTIIIDSCQKVCKSKVFLEFIVVNQMCIFILNMNLELPRHILLTEWAEQSQSQDRHLNHEECRYREKLKRIKQQCKC